MTDWKAIKAEYMTTNTSLRKLAKKYGLSPTAVCHKSKTEHWVEERKQYLDKSYAKILEGATKNSANRAERLQTVADKLMNKVESLIEDDELIGSTTALRDITRVLKDLKDIQMVKSDADLREQEARIKNLEKQAKDNTLPEGVQYGVVMLPPIEELPQPPIEEDEE